MLLLPEDTKGNKQKACTSHFKSTSGQQFRDQSISIGGGGWVGAIGGWVTRF